jgi:hypothetical protein
MLFHIKTIVQSKFVSKLSNRLPQQEDYKHYEGKIDPENSGHFKFQRTSANDLINNSVGPGVHNP